VLQITPQMRILVCLEPVDFRNYAVRAFMRSHGYALELIGSLWPSNRPPMMRDSA
jgi:hypothetical protein